MNRFESITCDSPTTNPILLKIDIHVSFTIMHVLKSEFKKNNICSFKFMQLAIFC